jgi:hypothetical protein
MKSNVGKAFITLTFFTAIGFTALPAQAALLVSSSGDNSIKQYDDVTGQYIRDFVSSSSGGLSDPQGLALGSNGNLFVSSRRTNSVKEYSGTTGDYIGDFVSADDGLRSPIGLTFAKDGSLFVVGDTPVPSDDVLRSGFFQYDGNTGELLNSVLTGARGFSVAPVDVAVGGPSNNVYFSNSVFRFNEGNIREYDLTTNKLTASAFSGSSTPFSPQGLALDGSKLFYTNRREVGLIDLAGNTSNSLFVEVSSGGLDSAIGLTVGEDGNLYVSNSNTNSIKRYDGATGDFLGDFVTSSSGGLSRPTYLTSANVPVPEPSSVLGVVALGGLFIGGTLQRRMYNQKK